MNILFIGPYRQDDGWGVAAQNYIRALQTTPHNLAIRPIYMGSSYCETPPDIFELEYKSFASYDAVIYNVLPHLLTYDGRLGQNIGLFHTETNNLLYTSWIDRISLIDRGWVPSKASFNNIYFSFKIPTPIDIIPIPIDEQLFTRSYEPLQINDTKDTFNFYTIVDFNKRKNLHDLVVAFNTEFDPNEPVNLIIKIHQHGMTAAQLSQQIQSFLYNIKKNLRLYPNIEDYKQEIIIPNKITDEEMLRLHNTFDCYINVSYGESFNIPTLYAMGFGKTPIVTAKTGMCDIVSENEGWVVRSQKEVVYMENPPLYDLYTGRELWQSVNTHDLKQKMRLAYRDNTLRKILIKNGREKIHKFSYERVGQTMNKVLTCQAQ